ncbi:MAG: VRR-NUC domain-containing protein [Negativicutes bacterium]
MRERTIEKYFREQVKKRDGRALKFISPGLPGVPDRIVLYLGKVWFVEMKAPGRVATPLQRKVHDWFAWAGFPVAVLDSKESVQEWLSQHLGDKDGV